MKSTMDFVPVETMWGDRDIWLTIERGPEFLTVAKELSDYIAELPLTVEQNDKLVRLAVAKRQRRSGMRSLRGPGLAWSWAGPNKERTLSIRLFRTP